MEVSTSNLMSGGQVGSFTSSTTDSVSPTGNNLLLLTVVNRTGISVDPVEPTVTGNGLTWVVVESIVFDTRGASRRRITTFRAMGASPSSGTIAIDYGGQTQTNANWALDQSSGVDTSGTNGSGAIVQSAQNKDESLSVNTLVVTLGAFGDANNVAFGAFSTDDSTGIAVGSGFTQLGKFPAAAGANCVFTEWVNANDTSVDFSVSTNSQLGGIAIEIKADTGGSSQIPKGTLSMMGIGN